MGNPRYANGHRRRMLQANIMARDTHCWLCKRPIDKTLGMMRGRHGPKCQRTGCEGCVPHPRRPEVHEILPVSRGGSPYDLDNCVLTCRMCNNWIGNRTPDELRKARKIPVETAIDW